MNIQDERMIKAKIVDSGFNFQTGTSIRIRLKDIKYYRPASNNKDQTTLRINSLTVSNGGSYNSWVVVDVPPETFDKLFDNLIDLTQTS